MRKNTFPYLSLIVIVWAFFQNTCDDKTKASEDDIVIQREFLVENHPSNTLYGEAIIDGVTYKCDYKIEGKFDCRIKLKDPKEIILVVKDYSTHKEVGRTTYHPPVLAR